jgi:hypothetical protein
VHPLLRHGVARINGLNRALRLTRPALNTLIGVDVILIVRFVNAINGADLDARSIFRTNTRFTDDVGHTSAFLSCDECGLAEELDVLLDIACPVIGDIFLWENSLNWALRLTGSTIDALVGVDVVLILALVNAIGRAHVNTRGVFYSNTWFTNDTGHTAARRTTYTHRQRMREARLPPFWYFQNLTKQVGLGM